MSRTTSAAPSDETDTPADEVPIAPGTVHVLASLLLPIDSRGSAVVGRGFEFELTPALIEASRDRHGVVGWPALIDDEDRQVARWGEVRLRRGPWPSGEPVILRNTPEADIARQDEVQAALSMSLADREIEMKRISRDYGPATSSRTLRASR